MPGLSDQLKKRHAFLRTRRACYREVFGVDSIAVRRVMTDLKRFCRYQTSTFSTEPHMQSYLNGRRDVLERIIGFLNLNDDQISRLYERES